MDNKSTTKRMIGAVVLVLIAALLLAWLLKGKNQSVQEQQDLIAEQPQEASPILGFPGVNEEDKNAAVQTLAQGEGSATDDGSYVIGAAAQVADQAQQQVRDTLAAGGEAATAAANQLGDAVNQAGQQVAATTGFDVRDPQSQSANVEQRPIVEDGQVKAGTGSMGGSDIASGSAQDQTQSGDATQASSGAAAAQSQLSADGATGAGVQQTQTAAADSDDVQPAKKVVNPKLVNEKPVPAPRTQSASAKTRSDATDRSANASSSANAAASSASAGGRGYAIQVLAASSRSKAEGVRSDIARDGYPAFVVRASVNGKTVYRVRIGTYPAKGSARAVQARMKARYTQNQYVQNSFVTKN